MIKGYTTDAINIIPNLQPLSDDPEWTEMESTARIKGNLEKLSKVRSELIRLYNDEFLNVLISQSVSKKDRYKPVLHKKIKPGDVVLLKEEFLKSSQYPMGLVKEITSNSLGEITGAIVEKANTKELVKRHATVLIPLLSVDDSIETVKKDGIVNNDNSNNLRPKRRAAEECDRKNKDLFSN